MKLAFRKVDTLPRLAWCAKIKRGNRSIEVFHGPWVEVAKDFFCEGAWSGDFASADFETGMFMGTGGKITGDSLIVVSPNHTLDRIWLIKYNETLLVSNSLIFVMAQANDDVDQRSLLYDSRLASIKYGLKKYVQSIPTRNGGQVQIYYHCNLFIDNDLHVIEKPKMFVRDFVNYSDYKTFLEENVVAIHANANDSQRQFKYAPIATISSGYDSPAAAVLARKVGCDEALTFREARGNKDTSDSGTRIASILGMRVKTYGRLDYLKQTGFPEADTFSPCEFASFADKLKGRILFTGFNGDMVWDKNCKTCSPNIVRGDASGHALTEFRLRHGYVHMPVAFLGCTSHLSIHRISNSEEMMPWSTGKSYDRPIPRRLVEESGVDRNLFGTKKRAVGVYVTKESIKSTMTKESFADFAFFCQENWNLRLAAKSLLLRSIRIVCNMNKWFNRAFSYVLKETVGTTVNLPLLIPYRIEAMTYGYIGRESLLFQWAAKKLMPRYKIPSKVSRKSKRPRSQTASI